MNGAESLARTLAAGGVEVCFANPGTSEMHFVAALDRVEGIRSVLCLFEGVATGAADGYARMADKPAATLLHLGPGLANGLANLHNARRARSPVVNVVGEHATHHRRFDAPLTADIEALAGQYSAWMRTSEDSRSVARDGAEAVAAARTPPGGISTLILPADTAWNPGSGIARCPRFPSARGGRGRVAEAAEALGSGEPALILLGDRAMRADGIALAARIAERTGARILAETFNARTERGAGRFPVDRVPYAIDLALKALAGVRRIVLVGSVPRWPSSAIRASPARWPSPAAASTSWPSPPRTRWRRWPASPKGWGRARPPPADRPGPRSRARARSTPPPSPG
jgi:acetolactate synthase-1/2/3 large subunit